jgi:hypothetical protein
MAIQADCWVAMKISLTLKGGNQQKVRKILLAFS